MKKEYEVYTLKGEKHATFFCENDKEALTYFVENFDDCSFYYKKVETEEQES